MPAIINLPYLNSFRQEIFHLDPSRRIKSPDQAMDYINERGILAFWPLKEIPMPSLWSAVAGSRPVADEHDDPGHVTWGWKDSWLGQRKCFYARILCKRNFFVSLATLPYLYALSNNFGDFHEDHIILYEEGRLPLAARTLYDAILTHGALDTIQLKRIGRFNGKAGDAEFNKAINELQLDFKLMPVGVSDSGAWHYSFIYDIVARQYPDLIQQCADLHPHDCHDYLILNYLHSVGAANVSHLIRLFRWDKKTVTRSLLRLSAKNGLRMDILNESDKSAEWVALPELVLQ